MGSRDLASRRPQTRFPHIRFCAKEPNVRGSAGPDGIVTISPTGSVASLHHRSSRPLSPTSGRDDNPWRSSIGSPRPRRRCRHAVRLCQCGGSGQPDGPSTHGHCYLILISWNLGHCACDCDCAVPLTSKARLLTSNCTLNACMSCLDLGIMSVSVTLNEPYGTVILEWSAAHDGTPATPARPTPVSRGSLGQ